jgi:hypothetical protein
MDRAIVSKVVFADRTPVATQLARHAALEVLQRLFVSAAGGPPDIGDLLDALRLIDDCLDGAGLDAVRGRAAAVPPRGRNDRRAGGRNHAVVAVTERDASEPGVELVVTVVALRLDEIRYLDPVGFRIAVDGAHFQLERARLHRPLRHVERLVRVAIALADWLQPFLRLQVHGVDGVRHEELELRRAARGYMF